MRDSVQLIKERLSIIDVISPYMELHKAGKSYKGKSPFTAEKTPSFHVSPDRGMYYCFSSSQGGDMFTFIETMEGVDFKGALKILAEKAGVELVPEDPKKRDERDTQYALIEEATKFYFDEREKRSEITTYISDRGVEGKTMHVWRIGYAPDEWRALRSHLTSKGFSDAQILKAGLIKNADGGKEPYDVFRDRVMFPISDSSGRVVAFSGRTLKKDDKTPKYVNSPETELFQKSEILYGYDKAKEGIRKFDFSLMVEGQFDVVLAHQAGYTNTVAVSGTALTAHQVGLLERLSHKIVLALDSDRAGIAAMKRASEIMLPKGIDAKVARMPDGKDPADIVKEEGVDALKKVIGSAKHVIEFLLSILKINTKDDRAYKLSVREEVIPLLAHMPNRIDREHFEGVVASAIETTTDAVHYEVSRLESTQKSPEQPVARESAPPAPQQSQDRTGRKNALLLYFAAFITVGPESLVEKANTALHTIFGEPFAPVSDTLDQQERSAVTFSLEAQIERTTLRELTEDVISKLTELHTLIVKERIRERKMNLQRMEEAGDDAAVNAELTTLQVLQKDLVDEQFLAPFAVSS